MLPVAIEESAALSPGCDLWIIADIEQSKWARKIDWYLNFQLMKAGLHVPPRVPAELERINVESGITPTLTRAIDSESPLLLASQRFLPNRQTVSLPYRNDPEKWVTGCYQVWNGFKSPSLRVFLPDAFSVAHKNNASSKGFVSYWPKTNTELGTSLPSETRIQVVADFSGTLV